MVDHKFTFTLSQLSMAAGTHKSILIIQKEELMDLVGLDIFAYSGISMIDKPNNSTGMSSQSILGPRVFNYDKRDAACSRPCPICPP